MIRTCWELLHPVTGATLGFEWIEREATAPMPPPPDFVSVPVLRVLADVHRVLRWREARGGIVLRLDEARVGAPA